VPNASTIRRQTSGTQQLTIAPLLGTTITTTPTAFQLNNNGLTLTGGGVIPLSAGVTGLYQGTGQVLHIRGTGSYSGATAPSTTTLNLQLYEIPAALLPIANTLVGAQTFTNWNILTNASSGVKTVLQVTGSFNFDLFVQLDVSGNLTGTFTADVDGATVTPVVAITTVTGLVGEADLNFAVVATLGGAEVGVILTLTEFSIDWE
jgi:hypothetical protein